MSCCFFIILLSPSCFVKSVCIIMGKVNRRQWSWSNGAIYPRKYDYSSVCQPMSVYQTFRNSQWLNNRHVQTYFDYYSFLPKDTASLLYFIYIMTCLSLFMTSNKICNTGNSPFLQTLYIVKISYRRQCYLVSSHRCRCGVILQYMPAWIMLVEANCFI